MKNLLLIVLSIFTSTMTVAQWTSISSGTNEILYDVHFPTDSIGYIVGDNGITLKTIDRGENWTNIHSDSLISLNSVFFKNEEEGYASGENLYKTIDGGKSWKTIIKDSIRHFYEVTFVSDDIGYAGADNAIYKTINGGIKWEMVHMMKMGPLRSISFPTENTGYFIGGTNASDTLLKTTDNGESFQVISNDFLSIKEASHFLNDSTGYMCGWYNPLLVKTTDGGKTWSNLIDIPPSCFDVHFINENEGYYLKNGGGEYAIRKTYDGGESWETQLSGGDKWIHDFFFIDEETAIAVGDSGTIYRTDNGGGTVSVNPTNPSVDVKIFPNPVESELNIDFAPTVGNIKIIEQYSPIGQKVWSRKVLQHKTNIDVSSFSGGLYFLNITFESGNRTTKSVIIN